MNLKRNCFCLCEGKKDAFVLCRIFQKSGLGPPNGDRYAPFLEEEWDEDARHVVPGGDAEDDAANGDEVRVEYTDLDQVFLSKNLSFSVEFTYFAGNLVC